MKRSRILVSIIVLLLTGGGPANAVVAGQFRALLTPGGATQSEEEQSHEAGKIPALERRSARLRTPADRISIRQHVHVPISTLRVPSIPTEAPVRDSELRNGTGAPLLC